MVPCLCCWCAEMCTEHDALQQTHTHTARIFATILSLSVMISLGFGLGLKTELLGLCLESCGPVNITILSQWSFSCVANTNAASRQYPNFPSEMSVYMKIKSQNIQTAYTTMSILMSYDCICMKIHDQWNTYSSWVAAVLPDSQPVRLWLHFKLKQ